MKNITLPLTEEIIKDLHAGDIIYLSGEILTARDAAHKKITDLIKEKKPLPFDINGQTIYYAGPCPTPKNKASGSCGPTTSTRVDDYTEMLLDSGLKGMIGKGNRKEFVIESMKKNIAVYFAAIGGCGAMYGNAIKKSEVLAFSELLSEAVHKLTIDNFPVIVGIDYKGNSIY